MPTQMRLRSMPLLPPAELLAAATESVNPIASVLEKVQEPRLALRGQSRPKTERSSLRRAAPDKLSGTAATSRRQLSQRPLRLATARRTVS